MISALQNVLNFQTLMMSQQLKAGEEIEMMEATAEAVAEEEATVEVAAIAVAVAMTMIEVMEETLGEEEEEEEVAEVEEEAEVDIKTEITEEVMEIEDMTTTEVEVATTMMITVEAGAIEVVMEEVTPMVETNTSQETTITTVMMTKASLDQIQLNLLSEEDLLHSLDKDLLLQSKLVP